MNNNDELQALERVHTRLLSTPNDGLEKVLEQLLPRLILLSNNEVLRNKVLEMFGQILRRIKETNTIVPITSLLELMKPENMPFAVNFSITFIDTSIKTLPRNKFLDASKALLVALNSFAAYSVQSNALCYYSLHLLDCLAEASNLVKCSSYHILGDFYIDFCLIQSELRRDGVGSIQSGLSKERVDRLTLKKDHWKSADLKAYKKQLLETLPLRWIPSEQSVIISLICSNDLDSEVSSQAIYKVNGARSLFNVEENPSLILDYLLDFCINNNNTNRTSMREDIKCSILRWILKELRNNLTTSAKKILVLLVTDLSKADTSLKYKAELFHLADSLAEKMDDTSFSTSAVLFIACVKIYLKGFNSRVKEVSDSSNDALNAREHCYQLIDRICRRSINSVVNDVEMVLLLFRLLDFEDDRVLPKLYTALGAMRLTFETHAASDATKNVLRDLLKTSRTSDEYKKRLTTIQWAKDVLGWEAITIESMILLADDKNALVSQLVTTEFINLRRHCSDTSIENTSLVNCVLEILVDSFTLLINENGAMKAVATCEMFSTAAVILSSILQRCANYTPDSFSLINVDQWYNIASKGVDPSPLDDNLLSMVLSTISKLPIDDKSLPSGVINSVAAVIRNCLLIGKANTRETCRNLLANKFISWFEKASELGATQISQSLGICCIGADTNFCSNLYRILHHKFNVSYPIRSNAVVGSLLALCYFLISVKVSTINLDQDNSEIQLINCFKDILSDTSTKANVDSFDRNIAITSLHCICMITSYFSTSNFTDIIGMVKTMIQHKDIYISAAAIECLTRISLLEDVDASFYLSVWECLTQNSRLEVDNVHSRFALAEGTVRMVWATEKKSSGQVSACMLLNFYKFIETIIASSNENIRGTAAVILLVLFKQLDINLFQNEWLLQCSEWFLLLMKEKAPFIQDVSCSGLCHLYNIAIDKIQVSGTKKNIADSIASEVIRALTISENNLAKALAIQEREAARELERQAEAIGERLMDTISRQHEPAVAGGGGGNTTVDPLAAAAARAAAELGINPENLAPGTNRSRTTDIADYGIYSTICKVAKKTGDPSIVFGCFSLLRRDPSFGVGETEVLYNRYKPAMAKINASRIKAILPILYMSKYEPLQQIREVMRSLWDALITPDLQIFVAASHKEFLKHFAANLASKSWREREAACLALESYLPQRNWNTDVKPFVEPLFLEGLRVIDDMRDSVRTAAIGFMRKLASQMEDAVNFSAEIVIPLILDKGLLTTSAEGKGLSLGLLANMIKKAERNVLKNWLPRLVSTLVESMSALEPKVLQYMQFHTARLQISEEELENMRLKLSQQSPMQESLDLCLRALGTETFADVIEQLSQHLRRGVGMPTRCAAVNSMTYLAEMYPAEIGPLSVKPFNIIFQCLVESSRMGTTLTHALVGGFGALSKVIPRQCLAAACNDLVDVSFRTRDCDYDPIILAQCAQQMISRAGDQIIDDNLWVKVLACSYAGTFDDVSKNIWSTVWSDALSSSNAGNKSTALLRMFPLCCNTVANLLCDLSWIKRTQGMMMFNDMIASLNSQQLAPNIGSIIEKLLCTIPGRIWTGQGQALETITTVITKMPERLDLGLGRDVILTLNPDTIKLTYDNMLQKKNNNEEMVVNEETIAIEESQSYTNWRISALGLIKLFLHEAQRGDKEYRFASARACAALPWKYIGTNNPEVFEDILPELLILAGIPFGEENERNDDEMKISEEVETKQTIASSSNKRTSRQKSSFMFGNRYNDLMPSKHMRINPSNSSETSNIITNSTSMVISHEEDIIQQQNIQVSVDSSAPRSETEPAFRMKFVECVIMSWPQLNKPTLQPFILQWALNSVKTNVWSIRKVAIDILGVTFYSDIEESTIQMIIEALSYSINDTKYSKIRVAALEALINIIKNEKNLSILKSHHSQEIVALLRRATVDTQAVVLEAASKLQDLWK